MEAPTGEAAAIKPASATKPNDAASPALKPKGAASPATKPKNAASPAAKPKDAPAACAEPKDAASPALKPIGVASPATKPKDAASPLIKAKGSASPASKPQGAPAPVAEPKGGDTPASDKKGTAQSNSPSKKAANAAKSKVAAPPLKAAAAGREDNLMYDLAHLAAYDMAPVHPSTDLGAYSRDSVQLLVNKIFMTLDRSSTEEGMVVTLPTQQVFRLPRSKPIPKEKPKTRWQQFMEDRNMKKRKRSKLVFDEISGDWKPRWGAKSAKKREEKANGIVELKDGDDSTENPFTRMAAEKKLLRARQKMREVRNKVEALGGKLKAASPGLGKEGALPGQGSGRGKDGLREAIKRAQGSSASMGKFDRVAPNEATNLQKKRKPNFAANATEEKEKYLKAANRVFRGDSTVDKEKAAKAGARASQGQKTKQKGGKGPTRRSKQGGRKKGGKR